MLYLNPLGVEIFIKKAVSNNIDPHWDNYDLIIWKKIVMAIQIKKACLEKMHGE